MKIRTQKREGNTFVLEVEEDYASFVQQFEKVLSQASREVKISGFRPGKAPREMVERFLNREALENRAVQELVAEIYPKVIEEAKLDPVDYPKVEVLENQKDKPLIFKLSVDVYPEVKLGKYKGIKVESPSSKVTEEEVLKVLGNLQERFATTNAEGKRELLPLDDEFAKKVSRYGTLAELKEEIKAALEKEKKAEAEAEVKNRLIAAASAEAKVDIPKAMIEREIDIMLDELRTSLAQSNLTLEDYLRGAKKEENALRDEMRKSAEIRAKGKIVLKAIAHAENLKVTPEEMAAEMGSLAEAAGIEVEEFEKKLDEGAKKYIEDYLLRRKALDFLVEKAKIVEAS